MYYCILQNISGTTVQQEPFPFVQKKALSETASLSSLHIHNLLLLCRRTARSATNHKTAPVRERVISHLCDSGAKFKNTIASTAQDFRKQEAEMAEMIWRFGALGWV